MRRWLVMALILLQSLVAGCERESAAPLRIGTNVWIGSEPLYLARELGALDSRTVRLVEYPSASEVLRAFRNQALDGMVISLDEVLSLAADGLQPIVVLVVDVSDGADVVLGRAGLESMRDLQGKRIAVESGAVGAYVLSRALTLNAMAPADVQIVHLESNEHPLAFEQGRVEAAVSFDPYRSQILRAGAVTLFDSTRIPGEIVDLLTVRREVLEHNPQRVASMLKGWFAALDHLAREPDDAASRMGVRHQINGAQFRERLRGLRFPDLDENLRMLDGHTPGLARSGQRLVSLMQDAKLLADPVDIAALLESGPLRAQRP